MSVTRSSIFALSLVTAGLFSAIRTTADVMPAQFQAVIYEVELPPDFAGKIDAANLTNQASTPEALQSALAKTGKARVLYRIDQPVNVLAENIAIGSSEPVTRPGTGTDSSGQATTVNSYQNIGTVLRMSATRNPAGTAEVKMHLQVAGLGRSGPPVIFEHAHPFEADHPVVLVSDRSFSSDGAGRPAQFVVRYLFTKAGDAITKAPAKPQISDNALQAQFQVNVYEIHGTPEQAGKLDARALTREAGTPESLQKALAGFGKTETLYNIDQEVNVLSGNAQFSTNVPVKSGTRIGTTGDELSATTFRRLGANARFSDGATQGSERPAIPEFNMALGVSSMSDSEVELVRGQKMNAFQTLAVTHRETLEFGRPEVMVFVRLSSTTTNAVPVAYVIRYLFNPPAGK